MRPLAIIPAKHESTGISHKNFRALCGKSPVERAMECCDQAGIPYVVSTEQTDSGHLQDDLVLVVQQVLARVGPEYDPILLVQPTQPLRKPEHVRLALRCLQDHDSVASVVETETVDKLLWEGREEPLVTRRQEGRTTYYFDGTFYGFTRDRFLRTHRFTGSDMALVFIPKSESCRLDDWDDWRIAEQRIRGQEPHSS